MIISSIYDYYSETKLHTESTEREAHSFGPSNPSPALNVLRDEAPNLAYVINLHCYQIILTEEIPVEILILADHFRYPISCLLATGNSGVSYKLRFLTATDLQCAVSKGFFFFASYDKEFIIMQSLGKNLL